MQEYQLEENEERSMIEPKSFENPKLKELIRVLMDWINDELHMERIIVQVRHKFEHLIINVHIKNYAAEYLHQIIKYLI